MFARMAMVAMFAARALAQEHAAAPPVADVTVAVIGDARGLDAYTAELRDRFKEAWIQRWPFRGAEQGNLVFYVRVNHAGYLGRANAGCPLASNLLACGPKESKSGLAPDRDYGRERMERAANDAFHSVFVGLPPGPPEDYAGSVIDLQVTFVFGAEKPRP